MSRKPRNNRTRRPNPEPTEEKVTPQAIRDGRFQAFRRDPSESIDAGGPSMEKVSMNMEGLEAIASMDRDELAALLAGSGGLSAQVEEGTRVRGTVSRVLRETLFVDVGAKAEAALPREEAAEAAIGDTVEAFVVRNDENGILLSTQLSGPAAEAYLEDARESKTPVEGRVVSRNAGGYDIRLGTVRAFCPRSMIDRLRPTDPDVYLGNTYPFLVIDTGDKIVVSRRAYLDIQSEVEVERFWNEALVGDIREGTVTSVHPWGVFVDLDGVDGLLHARDLGWGSAPGDTSRYATGQRVSVRIKRLDPSERKVGLTLRDPGENPWNLVGVQYVIGGTYEGRITGVETYGVFVELSPGLRGLLHHSKLKHLDRQSLTTGTEIMVVLEDIDTERQRLDLSAARDGATESESTIQVDQMVTGTIEQVLKNGVVVRLADERVAWLPAREVELPAGTVLAQRYRTGRQLTARVLSDDGRQPVLTAKAQGGKDGEAAWRDHVRDRKKSSSSQGFGTLGDLLAGLKRD